MMMLLKKLKKLKLEKKQITGGGGVTITIIINS